MKTKNYQETIEIPEEVEVKVDNYMVSIKGPKGEVKKELKNKKVSVSVEGNKIIIKTPLMTKREKKMIYSFKAHLKNMVKGVQEKFVYKLKICSGHFPMNVSVSKEQVIVKNFLGEKVPRVLNIKQGADVKMDGDMITITSCSKEIAGQIAADLEKLTSIRNRDNRIFQDGIYIIDKSGKLMDQN